MKSKDIVIVHGEVDPQKIFQSLANIIGDRHGTKITVTGVRKAEETKEETG